VLVDAMCFDYKKSPDEIASMSAWQFVLMRDRMIERHKRNSSGDGGGGGKSGNNMSPADFVSKMGGRSF